MSATRRAHRPVISLYSLVVVDVDDVQKVRIAVYAEPSLPTPPRAEPGTSHLPGHSSGRYGQESLLQISCQRDGMSGA
jgi:hypothetical protein